MRGDGLRDVIKLNQDGALLKPTFVDACRQTACHESGACGLKGRTSKLGVLGQRLLVTDRSVNSNPVCLSHGFDKPLCEVRRPRVVEVMLKTRSHRSRCATQAQHSRVASSRLQLETALARHKRRLSEGPGWRAVRGAVRAIVRPAAVGIAPRRPHTMLELCFKSLTACGRFSIFRRWRAAWTLSRARSRAGRITAMDARGTQCSCIRLGELR